MEGFLKQSTQVTVTVLVVSSSDHIVGKTGLSAGLTIYASKAGGGPASISPTVAELDATNMPGVYSLVLTTTHTNTLGELALHITGSGADPADYKWQVTTFDFATAIAQTGDGYSKTQYLPAVTAGNSGGVFIAGTNAPVTITGSGAALTLTSTAANGAGLTITGNGSGAGISSTGGATGPGLIASGGGNNANAHGIQGVAGGALANGLNTDRINATGPTTLTGAVSAPAGISAAITGNITGNLSGSVGSVPAVTLANGAHGGAATTITLQTAIAASIASCPDSAGVSTLVGRILGTLLAGNHNVQSGDSYAKVNDATIGLANIESIAAAIKVITDQIRFTTANQVDSKVIDKTGFALGVGGIAATAFAANAIASGALDSTATAAIAAAVHAASLAAESYAALGATPTESQMLYMIYSALSQFVIAATIISSKKLDGSTEAMQFTMNDATNPTQRIRTT